MRVYVINLPAQTERRQFMELQAAMLPSNLPVEFAEAVNGHALPEERLREDYDSAATQEYARREMTRGEIGCAMSHRAVYRAMLARGEEFAVVCEDDAMLGGEFPEVVEALAARIRPTERKVVLLSDSFSRSFSRHALYGRHGLYRALRSNLAVGYFLTRAAAEVLNREQTPIRRAADWWRDWERNGFIKVYGVSPGCVLHGLQHRDSHIGQRTGNHNIPLATRLKRLAQDFKAHLIP